MTGLPPKPGRRRRVPERQAPDAYERLVDWLLASPHYGERWARHWLDLVRYAETAGHEFDYEIPNAFRYRDYVIRAFNLDVPYDQFVVEHISGDALETPRRHPVEGFNESAIGRGFFVLGEGTHSPVDIREEQMRRIDNQLDVFSKTFLGLTLACARCHDHKFDPITSQDYYAMAGYLAQLAAPAGLHRRARSHRQIRERRSRRQGQGHRDPAGRTRSTAGTARGRPRLVHWRPPAPEQFRRASRRRDRSPSASRVRRLQPRPFDGWFVTGDAFGDRPTALVTFDSTARRRRTRLVSIAPGLAHSGLVSDRLQGVLRSRSFTIESRYIHFLAAGKGGRISVVIDGFEKIRSPIYGGLTTVIDSGSEPAMGDDGRRRCGLGHSAYFEIADGAVVDFGGATSQVDNGHGWIAVDEIRTSEQPAPIRPPRSRRPLDRARRRST